MAEETSVLTTESSGNILVEEDKEYILLITNSAPADSTYTTTVSLVVAGASNLFAGVAGLLALSHLI